jgi:hypothetical protein
MEKRYKEDGLAKLRMEGCRESKDRNGAHRKYVIEKYIWKRGIFYMKEALVYLKVLSSIVHRKTACFSCFRQSIRTNVLALLI